MSEDRPDYDGIPSTPPSPVLRALNEPFIKYYPRFAHAFGGADEAILLQHFIDWTRFSKDDWVFRTWREIEDATGITRKRQYEAAKRLCEHNVLEIDLRGIPARNYYRVNAGRVEGVLSPVPVEISTDQSPDKMGELAQLDTPSRPSNKETNQETKSIKKTSSSRSADEGESSFDIWYQRYPRRQKRLQAFAAWTKLTREQKSAALSGLDTFQFSEDPQYIPLPASWLNGQRWLDEPQPERKIDVNKLPPELKRRYDTVVQERTALRKDILPLPEGLQRDIDAWKRSQSV